MIDNGDDILQFEVDMFTDNDERKGIDIDRLPKYNALFYLLWNPETEMLFVPEIMKIPKDEYIEINKMAIVTRTLEEKPPQKLSDWNIMTLAMLARAAKLGFIADKQEIADYMDRTTPRIKYETELKEVLSQIDDSNRTELTARADELKKKIEETYKTEEDLLEEFLRDVKTPPEEMLLELNSRRENYSLQIGANEEWKVENEENLMLALRQHFEVKGSDGAMDIKATDQAIIEFMPNLKSIPISDSDWDEIQREIKEDVTLKKELLNQLIELRKKEKEKCDDSAETTTET